MDSKLKRRVSVATYWASTRVALLDSIEQYEDSYAITQEFREWITCMGDHPELLGDSVVGVPNDSINRMIDRAKDTDEMLEI